MTNVILWAAGIVLVILAVWRVRLPFLRLTELDRLADNAKRYESWRGARTSGGPDERTGADEMRDLLRHQVYLWAAAGILGVVLIVAGFALH